MTIKSQTHKGQGFNELRFEDELGQEEVFIHAQRDQNNVVKHDETTQVGRNRLEQIGNDEQIVIGNDLRRETGRDHTHSIGRTSRVTIGHDLMQQVGNNCSQSILANHHITIGGHSELSIQGHQRLTIGEGVNLDTVVYQLQASERVEFRSPGGSIVLDQEGITIDGLTLNLKGPTKAVASGSGSELALDLTAETGVRCEEKADEPRHLDGVHRRATPPRPLLPCADRSIGDAKEQHRPVAQEFAATVG